MLSKGPNYHLTGHTMILALQMSSFLPDGIRIATSDGTIDMTAFSESTLQVVFTPVGEENPPCYAIDGHPSKVRDDYREDANSIFYETDGISVTINKSPFNISYSYKNNILSFEAVGGRMSYLIAAADEWGKLAGNYTSLTGRQPMTPRWLVG
ncbi:MAG: DUF4968 domain-containing protein [Lewinellaceae bacterium]|nr:DUF4968 domain-containing protein [Lewinellaceae bacterium]